MTRATRMGMVRRRARSRLLERGVTVRAVAEAAVADETLTSRVLSGERPATSETAKRIVAAAEHLSGLSWAELRAPLAMEIDRAA